MSSESQEDQNNVEAEVEEATTAVAEAIETPDALSAAPEAATDTIGFIRELVGYAGAFLALVSVSLVTYLQNNATGSHRGLLVATFITWAVLPPLWLVLEYRFVWPHLSARGKTFREFGHEQSLARNFWMGIGAVLAVLVLLGKSA